MSRLSSEEESIVLEAYENFVAHLNGNTIDASIDTFFRATKCIQMPESRKLIGLATALRDEIGWRNVCKVYKYALHCEGQREGLYITWLVCAMEILKKRANDSSHDNGLEVIQESLEISRDALWNNPRHSGFAFFSGYFNYKYGQLYDETSAGFERALSWFLQAELWQQEDYGEVDNPIKFYLGQTYLALNQWANALKYYKSVDAALLGQEEDEELSIDLRNGILIANAAIAENSH